MSAVSIIVMPASSARWMMRTEVPWSFSPHAPNIIAPRQRGLTIMPVGPRLRGSMRLTVARTPLLVGAVLLGLATSSCTPAADPAPTPPSSDVGGPAGPLTTREVAGVATEVLGVEPFDVEPLPRRRGTPPGVVGADLGLPGGPGEPPDGEGVVVGVELDPDPDPGGCRAVVQADGCAARRVEGGVVRVSWQVQVPEGDPGAVAVSLTSRAGSTTVTQSGPDVTGDPRRLDLPFDVATMVDLARDPRLRLPRDTGPGTPERRRTGRAGLVEVWRHRLHTTGEPRPRVLSVGRSPLVRRWTGRTVAARITLAPTSRAPYRVVDLAVTDGAVPGWSDEAPCAVAAPVRCEVPVLGTGPQPVRWTPGRGGSVTLVRPRPHGHVLVRLAGWDVPTAYDDVVRATGWVALVALLADRSLPRGGSRGT